MLIRYVLAYLQLFLLNLKNTYNTTIQDKVMSVSMIIILILHFHQDLIVYKLQTFANFLHHQIFNLHQLSLLLIIIRKSLASKILLLIFRQILEIGKDL